MKTDKKTIKAVKHLLSNDSHSKHHLKIELTKNLLLHIFEIETEPEFVITPGQIESLELENNELKILVENLKAEKEIILRGSPDNRKITDVKLPLAGEDLFYITKQQIKIIQDSRELEEVKYITKEWFPEAFKEDKKELVSGWLKHTEGRFKDWLWYVDFETGENYGFNAGGQWDDEADNQIEYVKGRCEQATEQEVTEALTKEAVKRGYKQGVYAEFGTGGYIREIKSYAFNYNPNINILCIGSDGVFDDGKWAEIIPTITKEEAEKELGKKII